MITGVEIVGYEIPENATVTLVTFAHEGDILYVLWIIAGLLLLIVLDKFLVRYLRW
ncbi:TPA: hypothetical protein HA338_08890 [Methanosarcina acetivorans]|uniref:Uncharacterized protein n=1 Tax=Methanosarcina acetivorans TaxID=2214 RepID=A0A832W7D9_9EURY|nr:hypothetical protein [Methanosarcina acetivorans]HIH94144.1 hypothetical protein [Methanosarcina acetivorans]